MEAFVKLRALMHGPVRVVRRLSKMIFRRHFARVFGLPRTKFDYYAEVGDGTGSSTVAAPLNWIMRTFPEAPPSLWRMNADGLEEQIKQHEMLRLLRRPNRFVSGPLLWMATVADYFADGNAYWLKIRDRGGRLRELWWAPRWMMEPKGDETDFVTHYEYRPGWEAIPIAPSEVIHFRFGMDPDNPRKGMSPLKSVLREVFTDDEAANFTASLLRNNAVPGLVIAPDGDREPSPEDVETTKVYLKAMHGGDNRGEALIMSGPTKVQEFGFSPEKLLLKEIRRIPEERVSAVLGVPAIVAGLGAGLDRSTFTNYAEAREAAYEQNIIPTQTVLAEELWFQLLPEFESEDDLWEWRAGFDLANVRVLQEDRMNKARRLDLGIRGGWIQVAEGRKAEGLPVEDEDRIYLRQMNLVEVPSGGGEARALVNEDSSRQNGNGAVTALEVEQLLARQSTDIADEVVERLPRN